MNEIIDKARRLRRGDSGAERLFWSRVRDRRLGGLKFRRQAPIPPYVADFLIVEARLIIELDGDQHGRDRDQAHDLKRDAFLRAKGYEVLRIWNRRVYEAIADVLDEVLHAALMRRAELASGASPSPELTI